MKMTGKMLLTALLFTACAVRGTAPEHQKVAPELVTDHAYELQGRAPWKPIRVFNDGDRTMIDFPDAVRRTELPLLVLIRSEGGPVADDELVMVNTHYDPKARRMTVDSIVDQAVLFAGVGDDRVSVKIRRLPSER